MFSEVVIDLVEVSGDSKVFVNSLRVRLWSFVTLEVQRLEHVGKSVSTKHHLSLGYSSGILNVFFTWHLVLHNCGINCALGVLESFMGPDFDVQLGGICFSNVVLLHKHCSCVINFLPVTVVEWKVSKSSELVANGVPDCVEVRGSFAIGQVHEVPSKVTSWILVINSGSGVQWLMQVANVVDDESHGSRLTNFLSVYLVSIIHDHLVLVSILKSWRLFEPVG